MNNTAANIQTAEVIFTVKVNTLTDRQVNNRLDKIAALEAQIKALEEAKNALKAEVIAAMGDLRETDKYTVHNTTVTTNRFDSTRFKKDHKDLYDEYLKASTSTRFSYKAK